MINKNPLISIIIPAYNSARYIAATIESAIEQTYKNWEMIIVDDGSIDRTENIIESFKDPRIKYSKIPHGGCPAAVRNFGINRSEGEYIAFLDSDDIWHKQKLEKQLPHFQATEIIGVASNAVLVPETPYYRQRNWGKSKSGYVDYHYKDLLNYNPIITSSLIVRRETLERAGLFDENRDFCFIEDWELWLRMARYGSFRVLEEPLLSYRVSRKRGEQSATISKNCLKILEKQVDSGFAEYDDIIEPKASVYLAIARNLLEFDQQQSREYYFKALKTTSIFSRKIKSFMGILISFLPSFLRKIILLILYKADRILYNLKSRFRKIIKSFV